MERTADPAGLIVTYPARITGGEIIEFLTDLLHGDDFPNLRYFLADRSQVEEMLVSSDEIKRIAELNRQGRIVNPDHFVALVSPTNLIFGLSRMYEAYLDQGSFTYVCRTREEAEAWLHGKLGKPLNKCTE